MVYRGRLYMNFFQRVRQQFASDIDRHIEEGDARWTSMWGSLRAGPFNTDCLAETWGPPARYPCPASGCHSCMAHPQAVPGISPAPPPPPPPPPPPLLLEDARTYAHAENVERAD